MKVHRHLRWFLWGGLIGAAAATVLVILFRFTQSSLIFRTLWSVDWLGTWVALSVSDWVFPGDRIAYGVLNKAVFFDAVLILVTGLQTGILAECVGLIFWRNVRARGSP